MTTIRREERIRIEKTFPNISSSLLPGREISLVEIE